MIWNRISVALFLGALLNSALIAHTEPVQTELAVESVAGPGDSTRIGVVFKMEPGWHIYWANPGDAGLATEVLWEAPPGVHIGPLQWPAPEHFLSPGDITSFGYSDTALLVSEIAIPQIFAGGTIRAQASWLACRERCILGDAELTARLPFDADRVAPDAFADFDRRSPRELTADAAPFAARIERTPGLPRIWLTWAGIPSPLEVFPLTRGSSRVVAKTATRASLTRIDLQPIGVAPSNVSLVLVVDTGDSRSAFTFDITAIAAGTPAGMEEQP